MNALYKSYTTVRELTLSKEQFSHLVRIFPSLLVLVSDGIVDKEERLIMKVQASKLGYDFASEDFGMEKEENLMLVYQAEFRYLIKNRHNWERKFLDVLKEIIKDDQKEKSLIKETMQMFANASDGTSKEENYCMTSLIGYLELEE